MKRNHGDSHDRNFVYLYKVLSTSVKGHAIYLIVQSGPVKWHFNPLKPKLVQIRYKDKLLNAVRGNNRF
jgi:hypothetical protein